MLENIPVDEARQIQHIVELTIKQLQMRYPGDKPVLRGVHSKSHGCVSAIFKVRPKISRNLRHGVFNRLCRKFSALVRFSNAATLVTPDSKTGPNGVEHGSRGMAIKLLEVEGRSLGHVNGALTQDFLLINQPVFAFANVEDYEVLSRVLVDHKDDARPFFAERLPKPGGPAPTASQLRAAETAGLIARILIICGLLWCVDSGISVQVISSLISKCRFGRPARSNRIAILKTPHVSGPTAFPSRPSQHSGFHCRNLILRS